MRIGIDASNIGGGGGITHLKELLNHIDDIETLYGIKEIIVFSSDKVLRQITPNKKLTKVTFHQFNTGLLDRVIFQVKHYDKEIAARCDILLSITGDYVGTFQPLIGMSRNMLLYERDVWKEIKQPKEIIRFWLNFQKQKRCFKNASGIIFISDFAKKYVNDVLDISSKTEQQKISHGVSARFNGIVRTQEHILKYSQNNPFNFLYVSPIHVYKNQWRVVKAVAQLREKGYPVTLTLIGGVIFEPEGKLLEKTIRQVDPNSEFITFRGHVSYDKIDQYYKNAQGLIFASNCENMPNTLMESMASGVPIICSNKEPMPEFLKDGGFYFNPKSTDSIESTLKEFLIEPEKRNEMAQKNLTEIKNYNWEKTAKQTFDFISKIFKNENSK